MALHILNDAWHDRYDCAVLVSNDSDIAEALKFVKNEHKKKIGLIIPGHRHKSRVLMKYQDFMKEIRHGVLARITPKRLPIFGNGQLKTLKEHIQKGYTINRHWFGSRSR